MNNNNYCCSMGWSFTWRTPYQNGIGD